MALINALILVVIGIFIGFIATWLMMRDNSQHKDVKKALEKSQNELEQYRQGLVDHFSESADLLDNISRDYNKLYQRMAKASSELMQHQPEQDNPFSRQISHLPSPVDEKIVEKEIENEIEKKEEEKKEKEEKQPMDPDGSPVDLVKDVEKTA